MQGQDADLRWWNVTKRCASALFRFLCFSLVFLFDATSYVFLPTAVLTLQIKILHAESVGLNNSMVYKLVKIISLSACLDAGILLKCKCFSHNNTWQ